jgi:hypothetical protein
VVGEGGLKGGKDMLGFVEIGVEWWLVLMWKGY